MLIWFRDLISLKSIRKLQLVHDTDPLVPPLPMHFHLPRIHHPPAESISPQDQNTRSRIDAAPSPASRLDTDTSLAPMSSLCVVSKPHQMSLAVFLSRYPDVYVCRCQDSGV